MHVRPATGQRKANVALLTSKSRPQSAAVHSNPLDLPPRKTTTKTNGERIGATSDELIRDLEEKVRQVVELKRAKSDKLRFKVTKKREEVEKAKLVLQDIIKDSEALGLHYIASNHTTDDENGQTVMHNKIIEESDRLQPIASISKRPVYSKHTKINELEAKRKKQAKASHEILRSTIVLEHIKKRLLNERIEVMQATTELKIQLADLNHQTLSLQKKEISASEAESQIQTRLAQQKSDMAANLSKYKREAEMWQKWSHEKAKFENYYNNQMQTLLDAQGQNAISDQEVGTVGAVGDPSHINKSASHLHKNSVIGNDEEMYRQAFLRMGFGHDSESVDPNEILRTWFYHEEIKKSLDAKHDEDTERVAILRDQLAKSKNAAIEKVPCSKRGTSQRLETKETEILSMERSLATVVDQYMFVDQSVRSLKIGLQQILQSVSNETVNIDDMTGTEHALLRSIEEMTKLSHEALNESDSLSNRFATDEIQPDIAPFTKDGVATNTLKSTTKPGAVDADHVSSPFNIRILPNLKEPDFVLGGSTAPATMNDHIIHKEAEELDFEVMNRSTVKRISSMLVCSSTEKISKVDGYAKQLSK